ncbi:hypothetical protein DFJ73DRAFT_797442 [Zopfochytrium polystomum]|nr:hypothetical protein DFJ73DRAFT_797442 [Zopfochytrium polystomum]
MPFRQGEDPTTTRGPPHPDSATAAFGPAIAQSTRKPLPIRIPSPRLQPTSTTTTATLPILSGPLSAPLPGDSLSYAASPPDDRHHPHSPGDDSLSTGTDLDDSLSPQTSFSSLSSGSSVASDTPSHSRAYRNRAYNLRRLKTRNSLARQSLSIESRLAQDLTISSRVDEDDDEDEDHEDDDLTALGGIVSVLWRRSLNLAGEGGPSSNTPSNPSAPENAQSTIDEGILDSDRLARLDGLPRMAPSVAAASSEATGCATHLSKDDVSSATLNSRQ